jgi:hypothetical protein
MSGTGKSKLKEPNWFGGRRLIPFALPLMYILDARSTGA